MAIRDHSFCLRRVSKHFGQTDPRHHACRSWLDSPHLALRVVTVRAKPVWFKNARPSTTVNESTLPDSCGTVSIVSRQLSLTASPRHWAVQPGKKSCSVHGVPKASRKRSGNQPGLLSVTEKQAARHLPMPRDGDPAPAAHTHSTGAALKLRAHLHITLVTCKYSKSLLVISTFDSHACLHHLRVVSHPSPCCRF